MLNDILIPISVIDIILGLLLFMRNMKSRVNVFIGLFICSVGLWVASLYLFASTTHVFWAKIIFFVISLAFIFYLFFLNEFIKKIFSNNQTIFWVIIALAGLTLPVTLTDLVVSRVVGGSGFTGINLELGSLYLPVVLVYLILFFYAVYLMLRGYRNTEGLAKTQFRYLFAGIIIFSMFALTTNLIFPAIGIFSVNFLGPTFSLIMVAAITYAMVKHRLMDIGLAVIRSLSFIIMMLALIGVLAGSTFLMSLFVVGGLFEPWQSAIITFIVALIFWPLRTWITKATDKIFYKRTYDPQELMDAVSKKISSTLVMKEILSGVNELLSTYMKLSSCAFILFDENGDIVKEEKYKWADLDSSGLYYLANKGVLIRDDIEGNTDEKNILEKNGISVFQPVYNGKKLVGIFLAGEKKSGNLFSNQDIGIFSITAQSITVAIENAKSYEQIQEFNVTLRHKIAEATQELRVKNAMLKKLDKAKDEFVSMASHQLRTPLTSVKGYLSMVVEGDAGKVTKQQKELLDEAYSSNERMVSLVNDFLNVSRIQTGKFMLEKVPVDLSKLVGEEVNNLIQNATKRQIKLEYNPPTNVPELNIDEGKIRQVVMNYIDNAIYYSNPDSTIKIGLSVEGDDVVLTVKDTGIGVPVSEQAGLFTKFYRASNAKKQRPDGTGVGLYLAKKIITAHDGKIVFSTVEGKGSTFGFRLPVKELKTSADQEIEKLKD